MGQYDPEIYFFPFSLHVNYKEKSEKKFECIKELTLWCIQYYFVSFLIIYLKTNGNKFNILSHIDLKNMKVLINKIKNP